MEQLKEQLKKLRKQKGVFQKDVAAYLGIERTTYVKYENGSSEPDIAMLTRIADYFNVSVDYLIGRESESLKKHLSANTSSKAENPHIFTLLTKLDPLDQAKVEAYIDGLLSAEKYTKEGKHA